MKNGSSTIQAFTVTEHTATFRKIYIIRAKDKDFD